MILVDYRKGSKELRPIIKGFGVPCELENLPAGDAYFTGNGPHGSMDIGVERKALHDILHCIEDARYNAQRVEMKTLYKVSFMAIEGLWMPNGQDGTLMEGYDRGRAWGRCKFSSRPTMYSKLYRYLMSVTLSGVIITPSVNMEHTAYNIVEMFHYFNKPWNKHTSLLQPQKMNIPQLTGPPSVTKLWAVALEGIGVKHGIEAERIFRKPIVLANADESKWLQIPGVGAPTARKIVKEIHGVK